MSYDNSNSADLIFADLQDIANEFDAVEPAEDTGKNLPDGKYNVRIERLYFDKYNENERPILKYKFVVVDGEMEGRTQEKAGFLKTEQNISMFKADLLKAGLDMNGRGISFAVLQDHLQELIDVMLEINVVSSKKAVDKNGVPYVNVYINKRISDPFAGDPAVDALPNTPTPTATARPATAAPRTSQTATRAREQF